MSLHGHARWKADVALPQPARQIRREVSRKFVTYFQPNMVSKDDDLIQKVHELHWLAGTLQGY